MPPAHKKASGFVNYMVSFFERVNPVFDENKKHESPSNLFLTILQYFFHRRTFDIKSGRFDQFNVLNMIKVLRQRLYVPKSILFREEVPGTQIHIVPGRSPRRPS